MLSISMNSVTYENIFLFYKKVKFFCGANDFGSCELSVPNVLLSFFCYSFFRRIVVIKTENRKRIQNVI